MTERSLTGLRESSLRHCGYTGLLMPSGTSAALKLLICWRKSEMRQQSVCLLSNSVHPSFCPVVSYLWFKNMWDVKQSNQPVQNTTSPAHSGYDIHCWKSELHSLVKNQMTHRINLMLCSEAVMKIREQVLTMPTHSLEQNHVTELTASKNCSNMINFRVW